MINEKKLNEFFGKLACRPSSTTVYNQYGDSRILNNLKIYFNFLLERGGIGPFIVGEAPGYKGCRITGIPFTSSKQIASSSLALFISLREHFFFEKESGESTATIIWEHIGDDRKIPFFWNAFPFHPHKEGIEVSNRCPSELEVLEGKEFLNILIDLMDIKIVYALGRTAEKSLVQYFPHLKVNYIRHPSNGGKKDFLDGVKKKKLSSWKLG